MYSRVLTALIVFGIPAWADPGLFDKIHKKDVIPLVLPNGHCDARVVSREPNQLTVRLKGTTDACGERKSLAQLSRSDVQDVVDERRSTAYAPGESPVAHCVILVTTGAASTAGLAVGEATGSNLALLSVVAGSGIAAALLCRQGPRYTVFTDRIVPAQP
jgi:hypothetical protein